VYWNFWAEVQLHGGLVEFSKNFCGGKERHAYAGEDGKGSRGRIATTGPTGAAKPSSWKAGQTEGIGSVARTLLPRSGRT
jgi:hypothetical protein